MAVEIIKIFQENQKKAENKNILGPKRILWYRQGVSGAHFFMYMLDVTANIWLAGQILYLLNYELPALIAVCKISCRVGFSESFRSWEPETSLNIKRATERANVTIEFCEIQKRNGRKIAHLLI